jgi:hypothetical protein
VHDDAAEVPALTWIGGNHRLALFMRKAVMAATRSEADSHLTLCKANVVEHSCRVKQLRIKHQAPPFPDQRAPEVDPGEMVKKQVTFYVTNKLRYLTRHFAVRNPYAENVVSYHGFILRQVASESFWPFAMANKCAAARR